MTRRIVGIVVAGAAVALVVWSVARPRPEPADFTFNNGAEPKTLDPAAVTGQPEGRVIRGLFEGLIDWHPKTLDPVPGVAERWEISPDGTVYTFHLRDNAKWSDGTPVTAEDFVYSFRRFLDPATGAQYATLLYYVQGAEEYNTGKVEAGDRAEVELPFQDKSEKKRLPHTRNKVVRGRCLGVHEIEIPGEETAGKIYEIKVAGKTQLFSPLRHKLPAGDVKKLLATTKQREIHPCRQVLTSFDDEVAIRAIDSRTLRIELKYPVPYFLKLMGFYPLFPVNKKCVETHGYPDWVKPENIVTNGPFVLEFRRVRDRIRMRKSPTYWDKKNIHLNTVDALACESTTTAINMYMTGQVDYIDTVPVTIIPELLAQDRPDFQPEPYLGIYFYRLNTTREPLGDLRVRRALALALGQREVVEKVTRAGEIPADRFVPSGIPDYERAKQSYPNLKEAEVRTNVEQAKDLLFSAGYQVPGRPAEGKKRLPKIELLYNTNEAHQQIAELVQSQWKEELGIDVELVNKEWNSYLADQRNLAYYVARAGWIGDYSDPNTFLELFVSDGPQNETGWGSSQYDRLIAAAGSGEVDVGASLAGPVNIGASVEMLAHPATHVGAALQGTGIGVDIAASGRDRMKLLVAAEQIFLAEMPVIPIYYYVTKSMCRPYVKGLYKNVQDTHPFKGIRIDWEEKRRILQAEGIR